MRPATSPPNSPHDTGLDLIRICATFLVILTHVNMNGTAAFSPLWTSSNIINAIVRPCVPLFIMVTGALLLPRVDDINKLGNRMLRVVIVYVAWSLIIYCYFRIRGNNIPFTVAEIERFAFPLWYLKMLLAAYLFLPLLQLLYQGTSRRFLTLVCGLLFVLYFALPTLDEVNGSSLSGQYNFYIGQFNFGYVLYFIAGALCASLPLSRGLAGVAVLLFVASTSATVLGTVWLSNLRGAPAVAFIRYLSPTVMLQALSGFLVLRVVAAGWLPTAWTPGVRLVAGLTLGIYAMHIMVLEFVQSLGLSIYSFGIWLSAPVTTIVVFVVAGAITHILRSSRVSRPLVT